MKRVIDTDGQINSTIYNKYWGDHHVAAEGNNISFINRELVIYVIINYNYSYQCDNYNYSGT